MSIMAIKSKRYEITFGYDAGLQGFWLIVHYDYLAKTKGGLNEDEYLFHNMMDWPNIRMTITDVQDVLARFNETISGADLEELYKEALEYGYFVPLKAEDFILRKIEA